MSSGEKNGDGYLQCSVSVLLADFPNEKHGMSPLLPPHRNTLRQEGLNFP